MRYITTNGEPMSKGRTIVDLLNEAIESDRKADAILKAPFKTDDWKRTHEKVHRDRAYSLWMTARRMAAKHDGYFRK